jgi:hypothetical protein
MLLVAAVLAACASAPASDAVGPPSIVEVSNYNPLDVHVYVIVSGQRVSLGVVTTNNTESFRLPALAFASRDVAFLAMPIGSPRTYVSDELLIEPGDTVVWTITDNLAQSVITIR